MSLIQTLMRRAVLTMLVCLGVALLLALWRAQIDTDREARGSAHLAQLVAALSSLQSVPSAELPAQLARLQALNASEGLRHVRLRIQDAQGQALVAPVEAVPEPGGGGFSWLHPFGAVPDWRQQWTIPRSDGPPLTGILLANPGSEQDEALSGVLGLLAILCAFAALLLLGMYVAVRRAFRPLHDILQAIGQIENGSAARRLPALSCRELDRIGGALNHLSDALEAAQHSRRQLGVRIQTLQEDERAQIALDLHDEFGQQVTGLRANVRWLQRRTEGTADIQAVLQELDAECQRIQYGMRHLLQRLRPQGDGEATGLASWLQSLIDGWHARSGNPVRIELACDVGETRVPQEIAVTIFRMTQEALTNMARHARASQARIRVWREADTLHWQVVDDGVGLLAPEQAMLRGRGLAGLRERVWTHGGALAIQSPPTGGTQLRAQFPLAAQKVAA